MPNVCGIHYLEVDLLFQRITSYTIQTNKSSCCFGTISKQDAFHWYLINIISLTMTVKIAMVKIILCSLNGCSWVRIFSLFCWQMSSLIAAVKKIDHGYSRQSFNTSGKLNIMRYHTPFSFINFLGVVENAVQIQELV